MSSNDENNNQPGGPQRGPNPPRTSAISLIIAIALVAYLVYSMVPSMFGVSGTDSIPTSDVVAAVQDDRVSTLTYRVSSGELTGTYWTDDSDKGNDDKLVSFKSTYAGTDNLAELMESHPEVKYTVDTSSDEWLDMLLFSVLPTLLMVGVFIYFMRGMQGQGGGAMGFGKTKAKTTEETRPKVKFSDVAGVDEAVEELKEIRDFLAEPERFHKMGAKIPRGVLLVGPPGTGKTLLAKAVAGEAGVPFFQIAGSEFVEMFVGRGAAKVRDLFKQAKEKAPCIIFIDEIDAVGKKRDGSLNSNDEREQTLNQLLSEMDGFDNQKGIVVLAATNRPESLDQALLRPGRFDRRIPVELPDLAGREAILKIHANDVKMEPGNDLGVIARSTPGASGADLANIINESALRAVRFGRKRVSQEDLVESVDVVIAGEKKKSTVLSEHEKEVVSYHETGHAIVAAAQKGSAPVSKITIVPRTSGALGFTMQVEEDEHFLTTRQEAKNKIAVLCGGRAAEELIFGEMTTGASNDIEKATSIARAMVTQYGMSDKFGMVALGQQRNRYLGGGAELTCSEGTAQQIDAEVQRLVEEGHQQAVDTLKAHRFKLHEIAHYLQKKETITGDEFMNMLTRDDGFAPTLPKTQ